MTNRKSEPAASATPEQLTIASAMTALSHPRRVAIYETLSKAAPNSMSFRSLLEATKLSTSTLNHHLEPMQAARLVRRRLRGPTAVFDLRPEALAAIFTEMNASLEGLKRRRPASARPAAVAVVTNNGRSLVAVSS
ncbi:MAG: ArsR family transcriptional regulator [Pseudomonadota bacterium]